MKRLRHPNVVKLYGMVTRSHPLMVVMELLPHGPLNTFLASSGYPGSDQLSPVQRVGVCVGVCAGVRYLAGEGLIHGDLSARNVLVGSDLAVKVADFSFARLIRSPFPLLFPNPQENDHNTSGRQTTTTTPPPPLTTAINSYRWEAVEVLEGCGQSVWTDVWSFGVLMWEVFTRGRLPYNLLHTRQDVQDYVCEGGRLSRPRLCPQEPWDQLITRCWLEEPQQRPTFDDMLDYLKKWQENEANPKGIRKIKLGIFNRGFD
ncbi:hypothetical protein Pmani_031776 [Petrolisthes manimaculis]|uniref:Protein kinase domain-containing protein n=1 Tax=Petrolisthes manimaculis TaxID=1843537 RepID=A0AAE1NUE1_9EUCA|nr:hypothetical protein Pmani_031776 [Petrolisthes manimaculis]